MVTDEDENGTVVVNEKYRNASNSGSLNFGQLYELYRRDVYPAKLVFVSFLSQTDQGKMSTQLKKARVEHGQLRFDTKHPDLTKLDSLLGCGSSPARSRCVVLLAHRRSASHSMLASESASFANSVDDMTKKLSADVAATSATSASSSSSNSADAASSIAAAPAAAPAPSK